MIFSELMILLLAQKVKPEKNADDKIIVLIIC